MLYIFYDFESMQVKTIEGAPDVKIHESNLCIAMTTCSRCIEKGINDKNDCARCLHNQTGKIFKTGVVESYLKYVQNTAKHRKFFRVICVAHNSKGYDAQFILRHVMETPFQHRHL